MPIGLMNIGSGALKFYLDIDGFQEDYPELVENSVVKFVNISNSIQAWKKTNFTVLFKPNAFWNIKFSLRIFVNDYFKKIQTIVLNFSARPVREFRQEIFNTFFKVDDDLLQNEDTFKDQEMVCYFSDEFLDFRDSKINSKIERLLFLFNPSDKDVLEFCFCDFELTEFYNKYGEINTLS